jgi:hypothetical protein
MKCKCCNREEELRMGFCFDCANAESVIVEGLDMFEEEIPREGGLSLGMSKVKYILNLFFELKSK